MSNCDNIQREGVLSQSILRLYADIQDWDCIVYSLIYSRNFLCIAWFDNSYRINNILRARFLAYGLHQARGRL